MKNTNAIYTKDQSSLYLVRSLRSFNISLKMLWMSFDSVVASAILYVVVCWGYWRQQTPTDFTKWSTRPVKLNTCKVVSERRRARPRFYATWTRFPTYSPWCAGQPQEYIQHTTHPSKMYHRVSFLPAATQLLSQSFRSVNFPWISLDYLFHMAKIIYKASHWILNHTRVLTFCCTVGKMYIFFKYSSLFHAFLYL